MQVPLPSVSTVRVSLTVTIAHATVRRAFAWCSCAPTSLFHLAGAGRAATLADVLVLLAVEEHQEQPLAHRHRLAAARAVDQARFERAVARGLLTASRRRSPEHAAMVNASAASPQRRLPRRGPAAMTARDRRMPTVYIETY